MRQEAAAKLVNRALAAGTVLMVASLVLLFVPGKQAESFEFIVGLMLLLNFGAVKLRLFMNAPMEKPRQDAGDPST